MTCCQRCGETSIVWISRKFTTAERARSHRARRDLHRRRISFRQRSRHASSSIATISIVAAFVPPRPARYSRKTTGTIKERVVDQSSARRGVTITGRRIRPAGRYRRPLRTSISTPGTLPSAELRGSVRNRKASRSGSAPIDLPLKIGVAGVQESVTVSAAPTISTRRRRPPARNLSNDLPGGAIGRRVASLHGWRQQLRPARRIRPSAAAARSTTNARSTAST